MGLGGEGVPGFGVQGLTSKETDFECFGSLAAAWHHSSVFPTVDDINPALPQGP